jgi:serine/threonine protein phosphatase PrpC
MFSDSYFEIGSTHKICQDYALHGNLSNEMHYAIVSDGCSGSEYSEIGAQVLCHVAKYYINLFYFSGVLKECSVNTLTSLLSKSIYQRINEIRKLYPININSLEATLLIAIAFEKKAYTFMWGDGVIIEKHLDESVIIIDYDFPSNAPVYFITDHDLYKQRIDQQEECVLNQKTHLIISNKEVGTASSAILDPFKCIVKEYKADFSSTIQKGNLPISLTICSDGIKSYQDEQFKKIQIKDMAAEFIDFSSESPTFVNRNMNFLKRKNLKRKWTHYDDVSCASILL